MPKLKTNSTNQKVWYSAEQVISALMDDDSSSCDSDDTDTKSEKSEQNESLPPAKNVQHVQGKQYTQSSSTCQRSTQIFISIFI